MTGFPATASALYGVGAGMMGSGSGDSPGPALKSVGAGSEVPTPSSATEAATVRTITDDPTFWLVATLGVVALLAIASA